MDMNKILQNLEDAAEGEYTSSKQESTDMKMILESFYNVAQDDAVYSEPQQLDEIASVTMSGDSADEVAQLVKLMNDAGAPEAGPVGPQPTTMPASVDMPADGPPDMPPKDTMITPKMMDDFETEEEPVAEDDWDNAPEETYDDHHKMTKDLSGGINRSKKSYADAEDGDNAMAVESSLREQFSKMLRQRMSEKKDQDGDGDNDFDDVKIARMKASGMSHDKAVAKVKGKKDSEVDEDKDDPCWKNYKQVGMKKKNGKKVPNCVPKEGVEEEAAPKNNPVAKNSTKFNKAQVQKDKKKEQKKGKDVKHKGKDFAMESAPVFDRYVKPVINKTPRQMVEFYDKEARTIIGRLSKERRSLAENNKNTKMHDVVIGRLRENLDQVPEASNKKGTKSAN